MYTTRSDTHAHTHTDLGRRQTYAHIQTHAPILTQTHTYKTQTDSQPASQAGSQPARQAEQTDRQPASQLASQPASQPGSQPARQSRRTDRQAGSQPGRADRQTDGRTDGQTDRQTHDILTGMFTSSPCMDVCTHTHMCRNMRYAHAHTHRNM